jgi:hypothetical protein
MRTGTGIFLITTGAILLFALTAGSPHWLNLHVVGVILILAGAAGLLLPRLARTRPHRDRLRRWVRPGQLQASGGAPAGSGMGSNGDRPPAGRAEPPAEQTAPDPSAAASVPASEQLFSS